MLFIHGDRADDVKNAYRAALYELLMEATRPEFGDYKILSYTDASASRRQAQLLSEGIHLTVHWASPGTSIALAKVIGIPVDIQRGLLGYRICLTSSRSRVDWASVTDINSLAAVRIGQVDTWPDYEVYRANHLPLVGTPSFDGLFDMLAANRFDCLPLGADEVEPVYRSRLSQVPGLRIENSLLIYYEFPVYLYVSAQHPLLAKRLKRGFEIIQANGQFDALFERYFARDLKALNLASRHLVCLPSPFVASAHQCQSLTHLRYYHSEKAASHSLGTREKTQ